MWISAFLIAAEEVQSWGGAVLERDTARAAFPHQDSGEYFLAKRLIQRNSLLIFHQECCLGRGSARPGLSQLLLHRLFGTELSWDVVTAQISTASSCFLLRSPEIESAGSSNSKASKSLRYPEYESRNFSVAQVL